MWSVVKVSYSSSFLHLTVDVSVQLVCPLKRRHRATLQKKGGISSISQSLTLCLDCFQTLCINSPRELSNLEDCKDKLSRTRELSAPFHNQCSLLFLLWENMQGLAHDSHFNPCLCKQINLCLGNLENELNFSIFGVFHSSRKAGAILSFLADGKINPHAHASEPNFQHAVSHDKLL